jgi:hypothetical protein
MFTVHGMRGGAPQTTGQIQNREDFFEPAIAEVPPRDCLKTGLEFGAQVGDGFSGGGDLQVLRASLRRTCAARLNGSPMGGRGPWLFDDG